MHCLKTNIMCSRPANLSIFQRHFLMFVIKYYQKNSFDRLQIYSCHAFVVFRSASAHTFRIFSFNLSRSFSRNFRCLNFDHVSNYTQIFTKSSRWKSFRNIEDEATITPQLDKERKMPAHKNNYFTGKIWRANSKHWKRKATKNSYLSDTCYVFSI